MRRAPSGLSLLLAVDKPTGISSHDVVNRVRRALGERRVGHAGTLDPAASGVMVVGVGPAARLLGQLTLDDKRYVASIVFGTETSTDDEEGEVTLTAGVPVSLADTEVARAGVAALVGTYDQVPPAYSAISVDGKRAYARARAGQQVELPARTVSVYEAELLALSEGAPLVWTCAFHVSKGTYIRSLARDLGRAMGSAAHLCGLRRTASGSVDTACCLTLDELERLEVPALVERALNPVQALALPSHRLSEEELHEVKLGRRLPCPATIDAGGVLRAPQPGERLALVYGTLLMGVWECRGGALASVANFPNGVTGVK